MADEHRTDHLAAHEGRNACGAIHAAAELAIEQWSVLGAALVWSALWRPSHEVFPRKHRGNTMVEPKMEAAGIEPASAVAPRKASTSVVRT